MPDIEQHRIVAAVGPGLLGSYPPATEASPDETKDKSSAAASTRVLTIDKTRPVPSALRTLQGYIGFSADDNWFRLYDDETLNTFTLICKQDVVNYEPRDDEAAADGTIDVIWLSQDAQVARGRRQPLLNPTEARFLEGRFLTAGDVAGSTIGYRRPDTSALFGDANSPTCCRRPSSTYPS